MYVQTDSTICGTNQKWDSVSYLRKEKDGY